MDINKSSLESQKPVDERPDVVAHTAVHTTLQISVRGAVPADLAERLAAAHAVAIRSGKEA